MELHDIKCPDIKRKKKRFGKGQGTGQGGTAGRGHKGTKARSGGKVSAAFEGGQMPIHRRLPKRGFTNIFRVESRILNLSAIKDLNVEELDIPTMEKMGLVKKAGPNKKSPVKILASIEDEFTKKIVIKANAFSARAKEIIESNGGKAEVVE